MADLEDLATISDAYGIVRERRARSELRWNRLATFGLYIAAIFGAATLHGIWTRDDLGGLVMTIVPGLAMLGCWAYARLRVTQIIEGRSPGLVQRIASWTLVAAAIAVVGFAPRTRSNETRHEEAQVIRFDTSNVEMGSIIHPNGTVIPSHVRKNRPKRAEDCTGRWREAPAPRRPGETIGYCDLAPP